MPDIQQSLTSRFTQAINQAFGDQADDVDPMIKVSQNPKFGDYQANCCMSLAKQLGGKPRDVAGKIIEKLDILDMCDSPEIAGPGFINLTIKTQYIYQQIVELAGDDRIGVQADENPQTVVVDYSGPNVAKEMHVGHLRSTVIGDALARTLGFLGHNVIRQNHMGDWGTQFGMLIEFLINEQFDTSAKAHIADLNNFYKQAKEKFDADADFADRARSRVVDLQAGDKQAKNLWSYLVKESIKHVNEAYRRMDVTLSDDDIRPESFYNDKLPGVVQELEEKGLAAKSDGAVCVFPEGFTGQDNQPMGMIIQKSDGGYLYATTDLAAIRYRVDKLKADRVIYVTDARQKQHFAMVFKTAEAAGWIDENVSLEHVPFGTVLGEDNKPFKTREGDVVKLADLLDEAQQRAEEIVAQKNPELSEADRKEVGHTVGIGAVKYADLSSDRVKDYQFSWDRMLAMDGNTAPYLQYAYTRIQSIFRKAAPGRLGSEDVGETSGGAGILASAPGSSGGSSGEGDLGKLVAPCGRQLIIETAHERALIVKVMQFGSVTRSVAQFSEPHRMCTYLYELATSFSGFYENCPVLTAESENVKLSRLVLCDLTGRTLKQGLGLLGISVLSRM